MLSRYEDKVMSVLYKESKDKKSYLITPTDLLKTSGVETLSLTDLDKVVKDLSVDGYFDLVYSDRRGETVYCISLTEKGRGYQRNAKLIKRNLIYKLIVTVGFAFLSFVIGLLLKAIF